jgi:hypothetical protein
MHVMPHCVFCSYQHFIGTLSTVVRSRLKPDIFYHIEMDILSIVICNLLSVSLNLSIEKKDLCNMSNAFYCFETLFLTFFYKV